MREQSPPKNLLGANNSNIKNAYVPKEEKYTSTSTKKKVSNELESNSQMSSGYSYHYS